MKKWEEALRKAMKMYILLPEKRRQCTTKGYTPEKVRLSCLVYLFRHSQTMSLEIRRYEDGGDAVFNQQSLPGTTTGQALLPENDKPVDAFAAMKAQKQAEPVIDGMVLEEA